jgi:hypothetical protein
VPEPNAHNESVADGTQSFLKTIKESWELCVSMVGAITAIASGSSGVPRWIQIVAYAVAFLLLFGGGYIAHRKAQRRQRAKEKRDSVLRFREHAASKNTAFRGLYSFQEGDVLPGRHRQVEALRVVTQLADPRSRFGILCGEVGSGKTSLLRCAVQKLLKERGWGVLYITNSAGLFDAVISSDSSDPAKQKKIETAIAEHADSKLEPEKKNYAVILDQFEEVFVRYPEPQARLQIGSLINTLLDQSNQWRVLCAVRNEHLIDFQDFSPAIPDPFATSNIIQIKNFTVPQAADVIEECAQLDNLEMDEDFPKTLAGDLAEGNWVRPPELQIVCTALTGSFDLSDYYQQGGARGILSHYIDEAISISADKSLGSQVLRAVCDFATHTKQAPQTIEQLLDKIGNRPGTRERQRALLTSILKQFERAGLIVSLIERGQGITYALVHDYLVDVVDLATKGIATPSEEANQVLRYHLAGSRIQKRPLLGFRELRLIRKYADKASVTTPQARLLLKRSRNVLIRKALWIILLVGISAVVVFSYLTTKRGWKQSQLGQHWEPGQFVNAPRISVSFDHGLVMTGADQEVVDSDRAKLWEMKTGTFVRSIEGKNIWFSYSGNFIWSSAENGSTQLDDLVSGKRYQTPIKNRNDHIARNASDSALAYLDTSGTSSDTGSATRVVKIWSTFEQKEIGQVLDCDTNGYQRSFLAANGDRLVRLCMVDGRVTPQLWDTKKAEPIAALLADDDSYADYFDANDQASLIVTSSWTQDGRCRIQLWDLASGQRVRSGSVNPDYCKQEYTWNFTSNGSFIIIKRDNNLVSVLNTSDLSSPHWFSATYKDAVAASFSNRYLGWQVGDGTYIWQMGEPAPTLFKGMRLTRGGSGTITFGFQVSLKHDHAIVDKVNGFEIWSLKTAERLKDVLFTEDSLALDLSLDEGALVSTLTGGRIVLYSTETGDRIGELSGTGGRQFVYYDAGCKRAYIWTGEGRVLRYDQGTEVLGRWFIPTDKCP